MLRKWVLLRKKDRMHPPDFEPGETEIDFIYLIRYTEDTGEEHWRIYVVQPYMMYGFTDRELREMGEKLIMAVIGYDKGEEI